jgi:selenocysteine lyase/cysteine desulfurase
MNDISNAPQIMDSQRALFDVPREIAYLNAASWSPLPRASQEAGRAAVGRKGKPWTLAPDFAASQHERARAAAAALIGAAPEDVAIISSVGYGVATAAKLVDVAPGSRVLTIENDHSSPVLEWEVRAARGDFVVETVPRPADGDWTNAILAAIERPGAQPLSIASFSNIHWSDGGMVDLGRVAGALRRQAALLLVDATHAVGVLEIDVKALDPDFLIFPTYKWVVGPYGRAFIYVAKRHQDGVPLEQTSHGRRAVIATAPVYMSDKRYAAGARRFDMGERDHFVSLEMASIGMEMMARWGSEAIIGRLAMLTERLAAGIADCGVTLPDPKLRAPHILSVSFPNGMPDGLVQGLEADRVYVAPRLGRLRISPHVYNDEEDVDHFIASFRRLMR